MLRPRYRWRLREAVAPTVEMGATGSGIGLSERQIRLLADRGLGTSDLASFVAPAAEGLHDPYALPDAAAVVGRVALARRRHERVMVFGDFDADGLTGLAVLWSALRQIGLDVESHVPSRVADGHGLSRRAVEDAAALECRLIVTVDCGTASAAEIALAAERGIDVIVSDHHHVPPDLPAAIAVVNPQRVDSRYPDDRISGAGVALKLAQLLLREFGDGDALTRDATPPGLELAELAAIGTVADVAPLIGENRSIVRLGLERMRSRPRPGLAALLARAGVAPDRVDVETLGFVVAPRLNAAGRMGDATVAARLLLAEDPAEAAGLAERLEVANAERRSLLGTALDEARLAVQADPALAEARLLTVAGPWPPGIIGLVAGRLVEEFGRPVVVASMDVEPWRVSARGTGAFDLAAAFAACADLLDRHGGHRDAAGCSLVASGWDAFRMRVSSLAADLPAPDPMPALTVDLALPAAEVDYRLFRELDILEPTGPGNPEPLVAVGGLEVLRAKAVAGNSSQVTLRKGLEVLDGIAFGRSDLSESIDPGMRVDVVAHLASRAFGGYESLQLEIRDVATSGEAPWVRSSAGASENLAGGVPA